MKTSRAAAVSPEARITEHWEKGAGAKTSGAVVDPVLTPFNENEEAGVGEERPVVSGSSSQMPTASSNGKKDLQPVSTATEEKPEGEKKNAPQVEVTVKDLDLLLLKKTGLRARNREIRFEIKQKKLNRIVALTEEVGRKIWDRFYAASFGTTKTTLDGEFEEKISFPDAVLGYEMLQELFDDYSGEITKLEEPGKEFDICGEKISGAVFQVKVPHDGGETA